VSDISLITLLLHGAAGNWDEVILVAGGLGIAWAVIVFSGRGRDSESADNEVTT
jgi:hypothetical protein